MLANPSNFGPEGLNESPEKKNEMYRTMNLSKPSAMESACPNVEDSCVESHIGSVCLLRVVDMVG